MKQSLLFLISFFSYSFGFSQSEKELYGKVLSEGKALSTIDVVNINSKKSVTTDNHGNFSILVKPNDVLFIISKEYTDRKITITDADLNQENFTILLEKKPIELEDVTITRVKSMKIKLSQSDIDEIKIMKSTQTPKVLGVNDGTIENGVDFVRLAKRLYYAWRKKDNKKSEKKAPLPEFNDYIHATFADSFFVQKLKLKSEEIGLFLSFCEADSKAKTIVEAQDFFETMDFLVIKSEAFKKMEK